MIDDKETGEKFCRILLWTILNKEIRHIRIIPQKELYGLDTDMNSIRMNAYLEDISDCDALDADILPDIYDIDPNLSNPDIEFIHHRVERLKERELSCRTQKGDLCQHP